LRQRRANLSQATPENEQLKHSIDLKIKINCLQIVRCVLYFMPCLNWSTTKPFMSENLTNGLSLFEAFTNMYQSIIGMK
jgi:hypothetical protein